MIVARLFILTLSLCLIGQFIPNANGYELATHGAITYNTYQRSILKDSQFLKDLGIDTQINLNPAEPFGIIYYDVSGDTANQRQRHVFEGDIIQRLGATPLSLEGWLMRGAIREDDYPLGPNPQFDDPVNAIRPFNHFYDPVLNRALTTALGSLGKKAPDWGAGTSDIFSQPNREDAFRMNHFTVFDAREAMYRALTGVRLNNDGTTTVVAPTKSERDKYWATLFRALGDIVHLVQDMGQPQHTRNDRHAGKKFDSNFAPLGHKSVYENYVEAQATRTYFRTKDYVTNGQAANIWILPPELSYASYPVIPRFTDYLSYFTTRHKHPDTGQIPVRQGLADYSNRGFFSAGQNLDTTEYAFPSRNPGDYTPTSLYVNWAGQPLDNDDPTANATILMGAVSDSLPGGQSASNIPLTTRSLWDQFLVSRQQAPVYSLNRYNYDAMANLLVPRAVAYSAGLVDYFFRGRLVAEEVTFVDEAITLKVKNAIDVEKFPDYANEKLYNGGKLVVTREYKIGEEKRLDASAPVLLEEDIEPGKISQQSYTFSFPTTLPQGLASIKFRLVFRGKLGQEEDAVVAGAIRPLSGFVVTPNYAPADGLGGSRHIYKYANRWMLSDETGLVAGNIDWKGGYDPTTGKPTKTLSWNGPRSRYFPGWGAATTGDGPFVPEIYRDGELYAVAPRAVLGAALTKDANNVEWLLAIGKEGHADVVYRRPSKKSDSAALYDPVSNPDGWREIGRFTRDQSTYWEADRPWFFNGDGTEARTMRRGYKYLGPDIGNQQWLYELVIAIGDTATEVSGQEHAAIPNPWTESKDCQTDSYSDPDSVCVGNCEGVMNSHSSDMKTYRQSSSSVGEMAIAVDYSAMGPVYAKYSIRDNSTSTFSNETTSESSTVCGRDSYGGLNFCSSPSNYSLSISTRTAEDSPSYAEVISIAAGTIEASLWSRSGTRRTVYSARSETIGSTTTGTQTVEATSNQVVTWGFIQYLDLRNNTMSIYTQTVSEQGAGNADPASTQFGALLPALISARSEQKLYHAGGVTVIHENPQDNINTLVNQVFPRTYVELLGRNLGIVKTENDVSYLAMYSLDNQPGQGMACGQSQNHDPLRSEEIYSVPNNVGYWAADGNGNLLVSAAAKSYSPYRGVANKYFSYLTSGSLGQLIPTAPENPWYYNIGVIY